MRTLCTTALAALLSAAPARAGADPLARFDLPGGARLLVLHAPGAPRQSTFTFLPHGLTRDPCGAAQFAHLAEHLLVRSTDPDSLEPAGMQINGETTAWSLRLDTYAELGAWRESLARHARWSAARACDDGVLARERKRIAAEERSTTAGGFTHKWAEAAWSQVVHCGSEHVAVHGDVAAAELADAARWIEERVALGPGVVVASAGPVDPEELRDALVRELAAVAGARVDEPRASDARVPLTEEELRPAAAAAPRSDDPLADARVLALHATWDLDALHYLEWTALPDRRPADRVAGAALAQLVLFGLAQSGGPGFAEGRAYARTVALPEGRFLLLSASLADPSHMEAARAAFARALAGAESGAGMTMAGALLQLKAQASAIPDPAPLREQLERLGRDATLVEAQLVLNLANTEIELGLERDALLAAWKEVDAARMKALAQEAARAERRSSLLLSPRH